MNVLKKPEILITLANTCATLGMAIYFYKKTNNLEVQTAKLTGHLAEVVKRVGVLVNLKKQLEFLADNLKSTNNYVGMHNQELYTLKEIIRFQNNQITELQSVFIAIKPEENKTEIKLRDNHLLSNNQQPRGMLPPPPMQVGGLPAPMMAGAYQPNMGNRGGNMGGNPNTGNVMNSNMGGGNPNMNPNMGGGNMGNTMNPNMGGGNMGNPNMNPNMGNRGGNPNMGGNNPNMNRGNTGNPNMNGNRGGFDMLGFDANASNEEDDEATIAAVRNANNRGGFDNYFG